MKQNKAFRPNPALQKLGALVGEWTTENTHPMFPGLVLPGRCTAEWMEGGAFLHMHTEIDHEKFPDTISIYATDNVLEQIFLLHFDEREISRKCDVTFEGKVMKWIRKAPKFSQRYTFTFSEDNNTIVGKGEISTDDVSWEKDLDTTFKRIVQ